MLGITLRGRLVSNSQHLNFDWSDNDDVDEKKHAGNDKKHISDDKKHISDDLVLYTDDAYKQAIALLSDDVDVGGIDGDCHLCDAVH